MSKPSVRIANMEHELMATPGVASRAVTVADTALGVGTFGANTRYVLLQVQGYPVRYRLDGTAPTSSVGFTAAADDQLLLDVRAAGQLRLIRSTGDSATVYLQELTQ